MNERHLTLIFTEELHATPYMVTQKRCLWNKKFLLGSTSLKHNVQYAKLGHKLVMKQIPRYRFIGLYLFDTFNTQTLCASYKLELAYDTSHELTSYFHVGDTILLALTLKSSSSLSKCSEQKSKKILFMK